MKHNRTFILLILVSLSSCSRYRIINSSAHPIILNINYEYKDSANRIPFQVEQFNKEVKKNKITNYKTSISNSGGTISFEILSKKYTVLTSLILAAHNVKTIKPNANLTIQVIKQSAIVDTVYLIQNGQYVANKFKKKVSPNWFYKRFTFTCTDKLE